MSKAQRLWVGMWVCIFAFQFIGCSTLSTAQSQEKPRNVILFISDGCGPASFTMARDYLRFQGQETLALDDILVGSLRTYAADSRVTDSAASATALACGVKTQNGRISVDTLAQPVASILEAAEAKGMVTGIVATSRITHATPAAFVSHVSDRAQETDIAWQMVDKKVEVLLGGGKRMFLPESKGGTRKDDQDLLEKMGSKGYQIAQSRTELAALTATPILGLFTRDHMAYEIDRNAEVEPSLDEMTTKAIDLLKNHATGFFLMVEGSRIDHAAHGNDAAAHLHEVLAYDRAVAAALEFARHDGQTLVVSVSDHETGGLTLARRVDGIDHYAWNPEVLRPIRASHGEIIKKMQANGTAPCDVLAETAQIICTEQETPQLNALVVEANPAPLGNFLAEMISRRSLLGWTTEGHTAVDINLYAFGPGSSVFRGHHNNTEIGIRLAQLLEVDLNAATLSLRKATP